VTIGTKKLINRAKGVCGFLYLAVIALLTGMFYFAGFGGKSFGFPSELSGAALGLGIYSTLILIGAGIALFYRSKAGTVYLKTVTIINIVLAGIADAAAIAALVYMSVISVSDVKYIFHDFGMYFSPTETYIAVISTIVVSSLLIVYLSFALSFLSCIKNAYKGKTRKYVSKVFGITNIIIAVAVAAAAALLVFFWEYIKATDFISLSILGLFAVSALLAGIIPIRWANKAHELALVPEDEPIADEIAEDDTSEIQPAEAAALPDGDTSDELPAEAEGESIIAGADESDADSADERTMSMPLPMFADDDEDDTYESTSAASSDDGTPFVSDVSENEPEVISEPATEIDLSDIPEVEPDRLPEFEPESTVAVLSPATVLDAVPESAPIFDSDATTPITPPCYAQEGTVAEPAAFAAAAAAVAPGPRTAAPAAAPGEAKYVIFEYSENTII